MRSTTQTVSFLVCRTATDMHRRQQLHRTRGPIRVHGARVCLEYVEYVEYVRVLQSARRECHYLCEPRTLDEVVDLLHLSACAGAPTQTRRGRTDCGRTAPNGRRRSSAQADRRDGPSGFRVLGVLGVQGCAHWPRQGGSGGLLSGLPSPAALYCRWLRCSTRRWSAQCAQSIGSPPRQSEYRGGRPEYRVRVQRVYPTNVSK